MNNRSIKKILFVNLDSCLESTALYLKRFESTRCLVGNCNYDSLMLGFTQQSTRLTRLRLVHWTRCSSSWLINRDTKFNLKKESLVTTDPLWSDQVLIVWVYIIIRRGGYECLKLIQVKNLFFESFI